MYTKWCNKALIEEIFTKGVAMHVNLQAAVDQLLSREKNVLIWRGTTTGDFLTYLYSTYHLEKERQDIIRGESSTPSSGSEICKFFGNCKFLMPRRFDVEIRVSKFIANQR